MDSVGSSDDYRHADVYFDSINRGKIMSWQEFFKSRTSTWLLAAVLIFVLFLAGRMFVQKRTVDLQISKLETETEKIRRDNEELFGLIKYLNTPEYQEKEAREKLNMKKDGEYVVVLPPSATRDNDSQSVSAPASNFKQWFNYFFKSQ